MYRDDWSLYHRDTVTAYRHPVISGGAFGGLLVSLFFLYTVWKSHKNEHYEDELETMLNDERLEKIEYQAAGKSFLIALSIFIVAIFVALLLQQYPIAIILFNITAGSLLLFFSLYWYYSHRY